MCGTSLPELMPTAQVMAPAAQPAAPVTLPTVLPPGGRYCPGCGIVYGSDYTDAFCICGAELSSVLPGSTEPAATGPEIPPTHPPPVRPPTGTPSLVLYGADRRAIHFFPLTKDATLIGRLDAISGNFPDIDVDEWLDTPTARRISRQHALLLHSRATGTFALRPLPGNTGTQVETEMLLPGSDYPLKPGHRLILGGVARFKFEIT
jgi:hypothetical protein